MNDLDEILDFEETVDFNLSDNPDALAVEILDEDGLFNLNEDIGFENSKQLDEEETKDSTKNGDNDKTQRLGVDSSDTLDKEGNKESGKLETDNSIIPTLPPKENTLKPSSDTDVAKADAPQNPQQTNHHSQQNAQNYRGRGVRRNNEWNQGNVGGEFFNGGMSTFRSGYVPGLDGINAFIARGGNPIFGHHNNSMSARKSANQQQNTQRTTQATTQATPPKRKAPNDGFEQKEQDVKKAVATNGKSQALENKSTTSPSQKNVDRIKTPSTTITTKNSSNSTPEKPSKPGISPSTTNKAPVTKLKRRTTTLPSESTSSSKYMQDSKSTVKSVPKNNA
ncbi:17613_t:CDS:2 [Racocetra fulgida]|uniref:17613_t:CDS:1 n=1 Tax=Racocetra fulgida TaxID=60492 RepID=A0A9N9CUD7_9GLOM|nr:17613_t:CDS:2 [Racocetra fulgida]